ncbi:hypothetical protein KJ671_01055, partial [Patescibacteria group bacterium]|nr:hypothetical protein [Patescibacteria group bacterium]
MEEIIPILITIVVGLCCYLFQNIERVDYNKNFRYLWDLESINQTYLKLKSNEPEANLAKIHDAYVKSKQRLLNKSTLESKIKIYFYEIEHN